MQLVAIFCNYLQLHQPAIKLRFIRSLQQLRGSTGGPTRNSAKEQALALGDWVGFPDDIVANIIQSLRVLIVICCCMGRFTAVGMSGGRSRGQRAAVLGNAGTRHLITLSAVAIDLSNICDFCPPRRTSPINQFQICDD